MKKIHPRKKLTLIIGPMWSGKSALLIDILTGYLGTVAAARPAIDTRDPDDVIISRNGTSMQAYRFISGADLLQQLDEVGKFDLVGIDEAHMLEPESLLWLVGELMARDSNVIVCGLSHDSLAVPFEAIEHLAECADMTCQLKAACALCGDWTLHTARISTSTDRIAPGDTGYEPRCERCWEIR